MEAKKSKKAAIENQRGSWLLMGLVVALAFMFVSFEWTQHDVRVAAVSSDDSAATLTSCCVHSNETNMKASATTKPINNQEPR